MPTQLGNITFDTTLLNKVEVSGIIVDTINTVENIVAEAVSTAWKAGGSQPASAFSSNTLLTEANEGKVYNLSDALTITEANRQYFTENDTGTYPAGTNVAVIETTPATYRAATGTAVSGTVYYAKNGNYYTEVTVQEGDPVTGLYVRTSQPVYKYDVLAGSDASSVKKVKVGAHAYSGSTVAICGAASNKDGYMHSGDFHKLSGIAAKANVGFSTVTDGSSPVTAASGKINLLFSGAAPVTVGVYDATSGAKVALGVSNATTSSTGVVQLAGDPTLGWDTTTGVATASGVARYVDGQIDHANRYSSVDVHYTSGAYKKSGQVHASGDATLKISVGPNTKVESITNNTGYGGDIDTVVLDAIVPVKAIEVDGARQTPGSSGAINIPAATSSAPGVMKLYGDADGTETDGSVTQSVVHSISGSVTNLRNYSTVTWKKAAAGSTGTFTSGTANPASNASSLTVKANSPLTISGTAGSVTLGARVATGTYAGVTKLYANANGTNKDGTVTQSGIKAIADSVTALRNYSQITAKYQKWNSGGTGVEWVSGYVTPGTNSSTVTVRGNKSVQVDIEGNDIAISVARPDSNHDWPGVVTLEDTVGSSSGANKGIAASPLMVTNSMATRVKKSITLSGLRQVSNDTQTPIPASINSTDMPNTLYGLIKALKFAANHAS